MFRKAFVMESTNFFRNEGEIWSFLCKNIDIFLNYWEVGFYLKYCTSDPLWKTVKMWWKVDVSKKFCDGERKFYFEMTEECKVSCVKLDVWSIFAQKGTNILFY